MSSFRFDGQRLDDKLVTSISLLTAAGIPNVLWGNYLLTIYGVPTVVEGVAFVVPDALVDRSFSTLRGAGFHLCPENLDCVYSNGRRYLRATTHLHIADNLAIPLYRKSDVLWDLPDFELASKDNYPHIISASDTRLPLASLGRGRGRFLPELKSTRIPSATKYCEAIILLLCRDHDTLYTGYWMSILTYILEFVDGTDMFDEQYLGESYQKFYHALKNGDSNTFGLLDELRHELIKKRLLPIQED
ncbi:uncharacterized protein TRUGW13939_03063 [Talaromyces rugulosus]|uniref:Uncharacterized protein n=1 Tax=Talaromyces rugulosus TaxID=121627 RepID=A0A7H8QPS8_TALRU|nr:uncharacterized protein TRUGW13939_03063 [Talaromyces rugulosus]QKX55964.1 hypothetical protein TRUGW13939_03063 [Talaromyces rugulosus]